MNILLRLLFFLLGTFATPLERIRGVVRASNTETTYAQNLHVDINGGTVKFARDGQTETISMVQNTVSSSYAPLSSSSLFVSMGECEQLTYSPQQSSIPLKASSAGPYTYKKRIVTANNAQISFRVEEMSQISFESIFAKSGVLAAFTGFIPMRQTVPISGWLFVSSFDQSRNAMATIMQRCELTCTSPWSHQEQNYAVTFAAMCIDNTLNLVTPSDWSAY